MFTQLSGVSPRRLLWVLGLELMTSGLHDKHFYPLRHLINSFEKTLTFCICFESQELVVDTRAG